MSIAFTKLFGNGGAILGPTLFTNFFESRTWVAPQDGIAIVRGMGAGGGGARGTSGPATGGYSASWGCKIVRVNKGDSIQVEIGAPGVGRADIDGDGDGGAGGDTIITIAGVQYIAYGGPGGVFGGTSAPPDGPSPSANWDFGAASVKPGWGLPNFLTGGAGVDILAQGNNATTSDSVAVSGGGGTGSKSNGTTGGGAIRGGASARGTWSNATTTFDAVEIEWGIYFYGGAGGTGTGATGGGAGGGGAGRDVATGGGVGGAGGTGGGGGARGGGGGVGGAGGTGGGGGATGGGGGGGGGGQGFAHLKFYADMGV